MSHFVPKQNMTEEDIKLQFITPAITAKWPTNRITMETKITDGKINLRGNLVSRQKPKKADYVLYINENNPIAIVEAKDNKHTVSHGLQQAMTYAQMMGMGNLSKNSFELRLNNLQRVQLPDKAEGTRTALQAGDLLFSITGEVGMLGLIPAGFETAYINQHTAMIRFLPAIRNRYLPYFLLTDYAQNCYKGNQHGIKNSFRLDSISEILVPVPPPQEQEYIIRKIEKLFEIISLIRPLIV